MQTLITIHTAFVPIVIAAGAITLVCGIALLLLRRNGGSAPAALERFFHAFLWITAGIGVLQAIFGGLLFLSGCRPGEDLHFVYGAIVVLAIPVAYVYSDQKDVRRDIIIMSIAAVAIIGAAIRALATGPGVCH